MCVAGFSLRKKDKSQFGLFLGDLSIFCTEQDIVDTFQEYGEIVDVRIQRNKDTSRALSYGFIDFSTEEAAKRAMEERNGFVIKGRPLRYDHFARFLHFFLTQNLCVQDSSCRKAQ